MKSENMKQEGAKLSGNPMITFLVSQTIGIIGAGSLGEQVIDALYNKGHQKIIATRRNQEQLNRLSEKYKGIQTTSDNSYAVRESDVIILGVKPKLIDSVSEEIGHLAKSKLIISLAAAKTIEQIEHSLNNYSSRVARVMTGLFVEEEIAAHTLGDKCIGEDQEIIRYIFGQNAKPIEEYLLAHRTFIACDTGLIPKTIGEKIAQLEQLGMNRQDAREFYAATLHAIANRLSKGMSCEEVYREVGGPGSFTQRLGEELLEVYSLQKKQVEKTVEACGGNKS